MIQTLIRFVFSLGSLQDIWPKATNDAVCVCSVQTFFANIVLSASSFDKVSNECKHKYKYKHKLFIVCTCMYRGSSNSTDSISTVLAIVRFQIRTNYPHSSLQYGFFVAALLSVLTFNTYCLEQVSLTPLNLDKMRKNLVHLGKNSLNHR